MKALLLICSGSTVPPKGSKSKYPAQTTFDSDNQGLAIKICYHSLIKNSLVTYAKRLKMCILYKQVIPLFKS